jgi:uncharacterized pyridoxamine 5'-phosphate oxidase family protein
MATYVEMGSEEIAAFLAETRFVSVTTLRATGAPLTVPLGYVYENGSMYFTIKGGRGMITRLRRDPRMCAVVANEQFPTIAVIFEGNGEFVDDPGDEISRRINTRYMSTVPGLDVEAFQRNWLAGGRQVIRLTPTQITSWDSRKKQDYVEEAGITVSELRRAERQASS